MPNTLGSAAQLAGQSARLAYYYGLNRVVERRAAALGTRARYKPTRPVPQTRELLADLGRLLLRDASAVREGLYPPSEGEDGTALDHIVRVRAMLADLPSAFERRESEDAGSAKTVPAASDLPDYFTQDFHFQTGGYLTDDSARIYDVQVETLFMGSAALMRRQALAPIGSALRRRDQRRLALLDVACGTGRFLGQVRRAFPALQLSGLDLSRAYLAEAARGFAGLRPATWIEGNAETMPLPDASQDIVTCIFLFHELPPQVRRTVAREVARVLRPGGLFVFMDSLQMGDRPGWDGLLEAFPVRFHEPYFRHYSIDDLDALFTSVGLAPASDDTAFLSKLVTRRKA